MTTNNGVNNTERAYEWDDVIESDGGFELAKPGTYNFKVVAVERGRHEPKPGGKLPACNKAVVHIKLLDGQTEPVIFHNLFLHSSTESFLSQFFTGIGQKKKNEPLRMDWSKVEGSTGTCDVGIQEYNGNEYNEIKKFHEKTDVADTTWTPGAF